MQREPLGKRIPIAVRGGLVVGVAVAVGLGLLAFYHLPSDHPFSLPEAALLGSCAFTVHTIGTLIRGRRRHQL